MPDPCQPTDRLLQTIGARVRQRRKEQNLPRRVLAEKSNVSPRYLAQLESGAGNTSIILLARVAAALDKPIDWFLTATPTCDISDLYARADPDTRSKIHALLSPASRARRICLIGLRGAGKSTLGRLLAQRLDLPFVELNAEIETLAGMPIAEVIALYGPEGYRKLETEALAAIRDKHDHLVLAVAGGIVSNSETYDTVLKHFHTVWLRASPQDHMSRVRAQGDERPMAGNPAAMDQLKSLLTTRETQYARAQMQLDTSGKAVDETADMLLNLIRKAGF